MHQNPAMDHSGQEKDSEQNPEALQTSAQVQYATPLPEGYIKGWDVYNNEAKKVDSELVKDWTMSLNFLLVFAAIFAAVLSAFIIESKKLLEPDSASIMVDVLIFYTNNAANGTHVPYRQEEFHPTAEAISINCLLFGSLSFSMVAALGSVVALQWVADYDAAITRGGSSPEDRAKRRQFRFGGVADWRMGVIIAALPLLLHLSVVLFFAGVIQWMLTLNSTVGYVLVAGGATAAFFYLSTTLIAVVFVSAPFNTPLSRSMESLLQLPTLLRHLYSRLSSRLRLNSKLNINTYVQPERSEHTIVKSSTQLASQAFTWVGSVINISPESHQRSFLLLDSILRLSSAVNWSGVLLSPPWIRILDNLGRKHLSKSSCTTVTEEDIHEVSILMTVFESGLIKAQITPSDYVCEEEDEALPDDDDRSINGSFRLLRRLPAPSAIGMRSVILLSRWRHSRNLELWDAIIDCYSDEENNLPSATACLTILVREFCQSIGNLKDNGDWKVERIIGRFTDATRMNAVPFETVLRLTQLLESRVTGKEIRKPPSGIFSNFELYASRVGKHISLHNKLLHSKLLHLLAKTVHSAPKEYQEGYLREIIMVLWSGPAYPHGKGWKDECTSDDVPRAADRQARNAINDYLGCLNYLGPILRRLAMDLRDMIGPPGKYDIDYPKRSFTPEEVEWLITRIHSELKKLGFETSDLEPCIPLPRRLVIRTRKDEVATLPYVDLVGFICSGMDFIIRNHDTLEEERQLDEYLQNEESHYTCAGPISNQKTSERLIELLRTAGMLNGIDKGIHEK